jgi:hypothetical protein
MCMELSLQERNMPESSSCEKAEWPHHMQECIHAHALHMYFANVQGFFTWLQLIETGSMQPRLAAGIR